MSATLDPMTVEQRPPIAPYPSPVYGWYVVSILFLAYTLSFVDRTILNFLVAPIRADFHINDFQFSLIQGLAFAAFYTVMGIPLGRLADSVSRRGLITVGVAVWSLMTALCGLASNYRQLVMARFGVGFGEATLGPSAYSMIADYFPKEKRSLPMNVYSAGVMCGAGLANAFGGLVVQFTMSGGARSVAVLGNLKPWQAAFVLVGLPGILVVLLMSTVREPARRERMGDPRIATTIQYLRENWATFLSLIGGTTFFAMTNYSFMNWAPAWFERRYGWSQGRIGPYLGVVTVLFGTLGLVTAGILANRNLRSGNKAVYMKLMIATQSFVMVPILLSLAIDDPYWVLACIAVIIFCTAFPVGLGPAALQSVTPNEMRGQIIGAYYFVLALLAITVGPAAVGWLTTYFFQDDKAVRSSAVIVGLISSGLGVSVMVLGLRAYVQTVLKRSNDTLV